MDIVKQNASDITESQFISKLKVWEGAVNCFYCDGKGLVTCGIGSLIDPLHGIGSSKINKLEFYEVDRNGQPVAGLHRFSYSAHPNKIKESFDVIKNHRASYLQAPRLTTLRITEQSYITLFMKSDYIEAKKTASVFFTKLPAEAKYKSFTELPVNVQWALIDMSFNLGQTKLTKYQNLKKQLALGNFAEAAQESFRHGGIQANRNQSIYNWIYMYSQQAAVDAFDSWNRA